MPDLTDDRWQRLDALLDDALAQPADARAAWLRDACGADAALHAEAAALLADADAAADLLGESAAEYAAPMLSGSAADDTVGDAPGDGGPGDPDLAPGQHVGPYRIEGEAGRGGMGVVYRAARADGAFRKEVALKLVKRGMDTDEVLDRFRRERDLLAGLDHPGIARLLDGGAAPDGRPYLAMEFVEGEPITDYADARRLDVDARLALFDAACAAVQHAHSRLVVHLDLKPRHILVADAGPDEPPHVKLLDFGIARLLAPDAPDGLTATVHRRLTPAYAAPEQRRGERLTTAADVYALGVVLHELLVGARPTGGGSTGTLGAVSDGAAAARGTSPERLRRRLRGELGVIVATALRDDPADRYASVEALREDLGRAAAGLPLRARPPSAARRAALFLRRHRVGVAAGALVGLALTAGLVGTTWQARAAAREAERADRARRFALSLFSLADPSEAPGGVTADVLLRQGARRALAELSDDPLLQANVLFELSRVHLRLNRYGAADSLLRLSRSRLAEAGLATSPADARALAGLATVADGAADYEAADSLFGLALTRQRAAGRATPPLELAATLHDYGVLARNRNRLDSAAAFQTEALALRRRHAGAVSADVAESLKSLALVAHQRGQLDEAETLYREALALRIRLHGETHADIGVLSNSLASLLRTRGDLAGAEALYAQADAVQRRLFAGDHRNRVATLSNRAGLLAERGRPEAAEPLADTALAMAQRLFGDAHPSVAMAQSALALALADQGRRAEAETLARQALALYEQGAGPSHPSTGLMVVSVASQRLAQGDAAGAEALYRRADAIARASLPPDHPDRAHPLVGLGRAALAAGRPADAVEPLRRALALRRAGFDAAHPLVAEAEAALAAALVATGRPDEAAPLRASSLRVLRREARRSTHAAVRAYAVGRLSGR